MSKTNSDTIQPMYRPKYDVILAMSMITACLIVYLLELSCWSWKYNRGGKSTLKFRGGINRCVCWWCVHSHSDAPGPISCDIIMQFTSISQKNHCLQMPLFRECAKCYFQCLIPLGTAIFCYSFASVYVLFIKHNIVCRSRIPSFRAGPNVQAPSLLSQILNQG